MCTASKIAHFISHDGKSTTCLTRARRFNRRIECQQISLLGDGANHFQYRPDFFAVGRKTFNLGHGITHISGQVVNAARGPINNGQTITRRLVGITRGLCRLSRTAGDVLRCRTHFVRRGGSLIDLAILLLHASAGLGGDGGRLVCGATGILHRALNLGDDRLQLIQKTIEPARQLAQLIFFVVGKTPCQITFATGNVFQHIRHAEDGAGYAAGHQPHKHQSHHRGE